MERACFFGYGSLVNKSTHTYLDPKPATAKGWRRAWRKTNRRKAAYLTAVADTGCEIEGLVACVPSNDWAALDQRERGYDRINAQDAIQHSQSFMPTSLCIYAIAPEEQCAPDLSSPILLSYLDVVIQGYLQVFGEAGAQRFFETTSGWEAPILDDRATPVYPRHQLLSARERTFVDEALANRRVQIIS